MWPVFFIPHNKFQSTPPVKAATSNRVEENISIGISIHAAREGGDPEVRIADHIGKISIHAAREGGEAETNRRNQHFRKQQV